MHLLRTLGAEVKAVPEKPYKDPENYNHIARRLAEERGWFWANQFDNTANRDAHYRSTGPEIWKQTESKVSSFVAAVGTGGTLAGVSAYLTGQNPKIQIVEEGDSVNVAYEGKPRYVFPRKDCSLLPVPNTTVEMLAELLVTRLRAELEKMGARGLTAIEMEVEENFGQSAVYRERLG